MTNPCASCGKYPNGITMWDGMAEWRCPSCGAFNRFGEREE